MQTFEEKIQKLPIERLPEVEDFIETILQQEKMKKPTHLRMTWAGGLKDFREQYTSLELQSKALEW